MRYVIEDTETGEIFDGGNFVELVSLPQLFRIAAEVEQAVSYFRSLFWYRGNLKLWELESYLKAGAEDIGYQPEPVDNKRYSPDYYEAQVRS